MSKHTSPELLAQSIGYVLNNLNIESPAPESKIKTITFTGTSSGSGNCNLASDSGIPANQIITAYNDNFERGFIRYSQSAWRLVNVATTTWSTLANTSYSGTVVYLETSDNISNGDDTPQSVGINCCSLKSNVATEISINNTDRNFAWDKSDVIAISDSFDLDTSSYASIKIKEQGFYLILPSVKIRCQSNTNIIGKLYVNNTQVSSYSSYAATGSNNIGFIMPILLNNDDIIHITVASQNTNAWISTDDESYITIIKVS